jgi:hypothetical protein
MLSSLAEVNMQVRVNEARSGEATSLHAQIQALRQQLHHQAQFIQVFTGGLQSVHSSSITCCMGRQDAG